MRSRGPEGGAPSGPLWTTSPGVRYLAHVHLVCVFAGGGAVVGEDGGAVAVRVVVDERNGLVKVGRLQDHQHWAEDLLLVAGHLGLPEETGNTHTVRSVLTQKAPYLSAPPPSLFLWKIT